MFDSKRLVCSVSFIRRMNIVKTKNFVIAVAVRLYKVVAGRMGVNNADKQGLAQYNDMFEMATRLCRGYLQGSWKKITVKDITVKRISGGLSNWIYQARSLKSEELSDPKLSLMIAEKMSDLHQLNIPINKDSTWLWDTMDRWLQQPIKDVNWSRDNLELDQILSTNLCDEARWLKKHLTKLRSPVVFCHNDLQEGNILMKENDSSGCRSLCLIDYEYCAYNYRGFDIANHFIEWTYDYTNPIYPHYTVNRELFPTKDQQMEFLKRYSQCMGNEESIEIIFNEVQHFILASHLFWGIWSVVNSRMSKITFGYREYAVERLKSYFKLKDSLINNK